MEKLYQYPELYEAIANDGTADEVWLLDHLAKKYGNGGKRVLEPACGTGRYLAGLLRRGWHVCGYDYSTQMVSYARKRLKRWGKRAQIFRGDMRSFRSKQKFDLAFNLLSTFRHLKNDRDALAHLQSTARLIAPGGIYILGLDLSRYGQDLPDEEVWTAKYRGKKIHHVMLTMPAQKKTRLEKIINFVTIPNTGKEKVFESIYDLRSYDAGEIDALIRRSSWRIKACYGYDGKPTTLFGRSNAMWIVLNAK